MMGVGVARGRLRGCVFRYSGGLAQIIEGEREPRVLRWAQAGTLTVPYRESEDDAPLLDSVTVSSATGTSLRCHGNLSTLCAMATAVRHGLASHLVPAIIETYSSGKPVIFGPESGDKAVTVDGNGITVTRAVAVAGAGKEWPVPWSEIKQIGFAHIPRSDTTAPVYSIKIYRPNQERPSHVNVSDIANGNFLPYLLTYAAARNGVPIIELAGYADRKFGPRTGQAP